jgi:hypothetical protein
MSGIVAALDILAGQLQAVFPETLVVRDPGSVRPPCVHVGLPTGVGSNLAGGLSLEVPVYVVGTQPGDQAGMDPVLNMLPDLMRALGVNLTNPVTLQISEQVTYPAYRVTTRIKTREGTP